LNTSKKTPGVMVVPLHFKGAYNEVKIHILSLIDKLETKKNSNGF